MKCNLHILYTTPLTILLHVLKLLHLRVLYLETFLIT